MSRKFGLYLTALCLLLAGCGGKALAGGMGDPQAGEALFRQEAIRSAPACSTCHSLEPGVVVVGPQLAGIASRAGGRVPGMTAEAYLRQSILQPNAFIVPGFPAGVMYQGFRKALTGQELNDLIAFLQTLE